MEWITAPTAIAPAFVWRAMEAASLCTSTRTNWNAGGAADLANVRAAGERGFVDGEAPGLRERALSVALLLALGFIVSAIWSRLTHDSKALHYGKAQFRPNARRVSVFFPTGCVYTNELRNGEP